MTQERSTLTQVVNEVLAIRRAHNEAFAFDAGFDGGEFSASAHERMEEKELAEALARNGWTWRSITEEIERRQINPRWAKYVRMGWM